MDKIPLLSQMSTDLLVNALDHLHQIQHPKYDEYKKHVDKAVESAQQWPTLDDMELLCASFQSVIALAGTIQHEYFKCTGTQVDESQLSKMYANTPVFQDLFKEFREDKTEEEKNKIDALETTMKHADLISEEQQQQIVDDVLKTDSLVPKKFKDNVYADAKLIKKQIYDQ